MSEDPINETIFRLASERYFECGGTETPDFGHSSTIRHDPVRYVVLRNADQEELAIYRIDTDLSLGSPRQLLSEPKWPEPIYELDSHDHIHALGAISANYTLLENTVGFFFLLYTGMPEETAVNLFAKLSNELRINTLRDGLKESGHPKVVTDSVDYFLTSFMTIFNSRNTLMHAGPRRRSIFSDLAYTLAVPSDPLEESIELYKASKKSPAKSILYMPTLGELRAIADSAHAFRMYGTELFMHIATQFELDLFNHLIRKTSDDDVPVWIIDFFVRSARTLPDKPPQAAPLNPHSPEAPIE